MKIIHTITLPIILLNVAEIDSQYHKAWANYQKLYVNCENQPWHIYSPKVKPLTNKCLSGHFCRLDQVNYSFGRLETSGQCTACPANNICDINLPTWEAYKECCYKCINAVSCDAQAFWSARGKPDPLNDGDLTKCEKEALRKEISNVNNDNFRNVATLSPLCSQDGSYDRYQTTRSNPVCVDKTTGQAIADLVYDEYVTDAPTCLEPWPTPNTPYEERPSVIRREPCYEEHPRYRERYKCSGEDKLEEYTENEAPSGESGGQDLAYSVMIGFLAGLYHYFM